MQKIIRYVFAMVLALSLSVMSFAAQTRMLIPGGHTIGIRAYSDGLVVTGVEDGSPAQKAGLRQGDLLKEMNTVQELTAKISRGETLTLQVSRGGEVREVTLCPEKTRTGYCLGLYLRDSIAGIGTVSYYDAASGEFGALGHAISDLSGSAVLPITGGDVIASRVREVVKGVSGTAGQLKGEFDTTKTQGVIVKNTRHGIFGVTAAPKQEALPVAKASEVTPGKAFIYSNIRGDEVGKYAIEILKCYDPNDSGGRDLLIKVTDPALLKATGGIVQGMSGSPIIQNGKLVGAVTHVLVNTPNMGYGILMENMLEAAA